MEQIVVDDFLNQRVADMIALGKLVSALLGTQTAVEGLACTPTSPASMDVLVAPGQIYFLEAVDTTTYGDLSPTANILGHNVAANAENIMKQGLILSETTFALTAPSTSGDSVNYLISAAYQDQDTEDVVLNYYNSSNPSQPLQGQNNSGTAQPTLRQGKCVLTLTAGTAAATGTQQTPAVPSGQVGLWVITVANGQTSITSSSISVYPGAPFLSQKLFGLMTGGSVTVGDASAGTNEAVPRSQADLLYLKAIPFSDTGTANAYVVDDASVTSLIAGQRVSFLPANTNTGASTLDFAGLGALPIQDKYGNGLNPDAIEAGIVAVVTLNSGKTAWVLADAGAVPNATASNQPVALGQFASPIYSDNYVNTPADSTVYSTSLSFTAPSNGTILMMGFLITATNSGAFGNTELFVNGTEVGTYDDTTYPVTEVATVSVSSGTSYSLSLQTTTPSSGVSGFNMKLAVIFIPT